MRFSSDIRKSLIALCNAVFLLNAAAAWGDCCPATAGEPVEIAGMPCDHGGSADDSHGHESDCCISCIVAQVTQGAATPIDFVDPAPPALAQPPLAQPGQDPPYRPPNLRLS